MRQDVRNDVLQHDPRVPGTHGNGGPGESSFPDGQGVGPCHPVKHGDARDADRQEHGPDRRVEDDPDDQRAQEHGEGHEDVHDPADDEIDTPAEETEEETEDHLFLMRVVKAVNDGLPTGHYGVEDIA